jgi:hypothetical protein
MGLGIGIMQSQPPTLGFMQVGLDIVISASCKAQLQFQQTNYYQLLYITTTIYFQSAAVVGERNTNSNLHKALLVIGNLNELSLLHNIKRCWDKGNRDGISSSQGYDQGI